jgi:outer membrane protein assembly factor BamB
LGDLGFGSPSIGDGCVFITNDAGLYAFKIGPGSGDWPMFCQNSLHMSSSQQGVEYVRWPLTQPKYLGDLSNTWVTARFVWCNKTIASATIAWKIYFFDGKGNANSTDTQVFYVNESIHDWWSTFHHDLTHSGYSTSTAPNANQTLWSYTTGFYVGSSSPAVVGDIVYVGSEDNIVYALNASTGAFKWSYTTGGWVESSPTVAGGLVYLGSDDYKVYALNASTGAFKWSYTTGHYVDSSPAVVGGFVYVGSDDDRVYALNATTGHQLWNYTTGGWVWSSPAVANGVVYVGSEDDKVYALNATTGHQLWNYTTRNRVDSSPALAGGVVYVGSYDGKVYALNASTGAFKWSYTTGNWVLSSPAVAGGVVYVGSDDNRTYALNATTGAQIWNCTTGLSVSWDSSPAVAGGVVYVGSEDHNVYALNATTGKQVWKYKTGSMVDSSPAVANGIVYVGSDDYKVYAFGPSPVSTPIVRHVTFTESGLPPGTTWTVTFNGTMFSNSSSTITFNVISNGSYAYTVGSVSGYTASPLTGTVIVKGADVNQQITFTVIPEFPSLLVLPLFMISTLVATFVLRKKRNEST